MDDRINIGSDFKNGRGKEGVLILRGNKRGFQSL